MSESNVNISFSTVLDSFVEYVNANVDNDKIKKFIGTWRGRPVGETVVLIDTYLKEWQGNMHIYIAILCSTFGIQPELEVQQKLCEYLNCLQLMARDLINE